MNLPEAAAWRSSPSIFCILKNGGCGIEIFGFSSHVEHLDPSQDPPQLIVIKPIYEPCVSIVGRGFRKRGRENLSGYRLHH